MTASVESTWAQYAATCSGVGSPWPNTIASAPAASPAIGPPTVTVRRELAGAAVADGGVDPEVDALRRR